MFFEYRLRSPEAEYQQEKIENDFLYADTVDRSTPWGGQPSEALRELLSRLKDGPQIDLRLGRLRARVSPLLPRSLRRDSRSDTLFFVHAGTRSLMTAGAAHSEQPS